PVTGEPARPGTPPPSTAAAPAPAAPRTSSTPASGEQRLVIRAVELTWIRVQTDEGRIAEELLPAGASREWAAERRFLLTIGNAGGARGDADRRRSRRERGRRLREAGPGRGQARPGQLEPGCLFRDGSLPH